MKGWKETTSKLSGLSSSLRQSMDLASLMMLTACSRSARWFEAKLEERKPKPTETSTPNASPDVPASSPAKMEVDAKRSFNVSNLGVRIGTAPGSDKPILQFFDHQGTVANVQISLGQAKAIAESISLIEEDVRLFEFFESQFEEEK